MTIELVEQVACPAWPGLRYDLVTNLRERLVELGDSRNADHADNVPGVIAETRRGGLLARAFVAIPGDDPDVELADVLGELHDALRRIVS
jgi:hypothetical protein